MHVCVNDSAIQEFLAHFYFHIVDPKSIIFECQRLWEVLGFFFNLTWTLPGYVGNAIHQFHFELKLTDGTENVSMPVLESDNHAFLQDQEVFSYIIMLAL